MNTLSFFRHLSMLLVVATTFAATASVKKTDCLHRKNTICQSIIKLSPSMDLIKAYKLSNYFSRTAKKYKISPVLLVSIAFQESSFNLSAIRKVRGFLFNAVTKKYTMARVGSDFCMMQIHISNIKKMNLSVEKLLTSTQYCIDAGAKILVRYKRQYKQSNPRWWAYYNANSIDQRTVYYNKVSKHVNIVKKKYLRKKYSRKIASK